MTFGRVQQSDGVPKRVLVLGYARTGSTLLSEIINLHERVLCLFEPLRVAESNRIDYISALKDLNECRFNYLFETIDEDGLATPKKGFFLHVISDTLALSDGKVNFTELTNECNNSETVLVIKTIRLNFKWETRKFFHQNPHFKIIHLFRDPRGILSSRSDTAELINKTGLHSICDIISKDVQYGLSIRRKLPQNRYLLTSYEALIYSPINVTKKVYNTANLQITDHILHKVYNLTRSNTTIIGGYNSSLPRNGTTNVLRWQKTLSNKNLNKLISNLNCRYLINLAYKEDFQQL
ncbi:carbohydrate sulfotransferase 1-like [Convolutriloba macropyga]|uniref:carbohydrate sulfotransferase 1-like n=1 Tax=Convolutriloba macropyga TaxID=536237 RepID=UPI003F51E47F